MSDADTKMECKLLADMLQREVDRAEAGYESDRLENTINSLKRKVKEKRKFYFKRWYNTKSTIEKISYQIESYGWFFICWFIITPIVIIPYAVFKLYKRLRGPKR